MRPAEHPVAAGAVGAFIVVVAAVLLFRALAPDHVGANEASDVTTFHEPVAARLLDGEGLTTPEDEPAIRHPPGYPVLLAGAQAVVDPLGGSIAAASTWVAVVSAGLAASLLWLIAERVLDRRMAWITVGAWALYPVALWLAKQPNSELPYSMLLYGAVLVLVRAPTDRAVSLGRAVAVGGLAGAATLVRPAGLLLVVPLALAAGVWDRRADHRTALLPAAAVIAAAAALVVPWSVWASGQADHLVVVADAAGTNVLEGVSFGIDDAGEADDLAVPSGVRDLAVDAHDLEGERPDDGEVTSHVLEQAADHPGAMAQLVVLKAARSWYGTESGRWEPAAAAVQVVVLAGCGAGAALGWRRGGLARRYVAVVAALVATSWLTTIVVHSLLRHLVPTIGLAFPLLALALHALVTWCRGATGPPLDAPEGEDRGTAPAPRG